MKVEAFSLLEPLRIALQRKAVAACEREVERVGRQAPGLVRVCDAFAVERGDRGGGVAGDDALLGAWRARRAPRAPPGPWPRRLIRCLPFGTVPPRRRRRRRRSMWVRSPAAPTRR